MQRKDNYALFGLIMGTISGGLLGGLLYWATRQSGFAWLLPIGAGIGLWLGSLADRGQRWRP